MPLVSVIIPSYNHEKYVAEAIQSVLDQTLQDFEIIITDDGSPDNTVAEIKKFNDPRIQLFCFPHNKGAVTASNHCRKYAKGKYIAKLNSDDIFASDKLEKQVNYLENHPEIAMVFSQAEIINESGNPFVSEASGYLHIFEQPNRTRFEWLRYFFYHGNCLCHPSALFRQSVYNELGFYNPCYAQLPDFDFWIRTCLKHDIHILQEKLVKFRLRDNNMNASSNTPENHIRSEWEQAHILGHFFNISSLDELLKIFPELRGAYHHLDTALISFYIAMLCLKTDSIPHHHAGLKALQHLLLTSPELLEQKMSFSYPDFYKLVAASDVFRWQTKHQNFKALKAKYNLMLNSTSWKITQPLRWVKNFVS